MATSSDLGRGQWQGDISLARDFSPGGHSSHDNRSASGGSAPFEPSPGPFGDDVSPPGQTLPAPFSRNSGEPRPGRQPFTTFEGVSGIQRFSLSSGSRDVTDNGNQSKYFPAQAPLGHPGSEHRGVSSHNVPVEATVASAREASTLFRAPMNRSSALRTPRNLSTTNASHSRSRAHEADSTFVSSCVVAILEGRGGARGEVGLASIHLNNPCLILCQFADTRTYSRTLAKLSQLNPGEVLIPMTAGALDATAYSKLYQDIGQYCPHATVTHLQRKFFNEERGNQCVKHLCAPEYMSVELQLHHKSYRFDH